MSVCSSEVCSLSEKRSAVKAMAPIIEDPVRASPVPFSRGEVVSESFGATGQETMRQSENIETSEEGNLHITRKTKVEESFVRSQKMYTAEISSSQSAVQIRAASPELEQIMTRKQVYQSYDTARLTPQLKKPQPERCLTPEIENLMEKPHGTWSPMPPACLVRPISPHAIISYPPDIPSTHTAIHQPRIATPEQFQEARETVERFVDHSKHVHHSQTVAGGQTTQAYIQQSFSQQQQYTPRYDMSESFSAYNGRGNSGNISNNGNLNGQNFRNTCNTENNGNNPGAAHNFGGNGNGNPHNPGNNGNGNPGNHHGNGNPGNHHGNGNPGNHHGNGNPGNHHGNGNPGSHTGTGNNNGNGNPGNHNGNGNPGRKDSGNTGQTAGSGNPENQGGEEEPTVTEPDDSEEKYSRKSSGQSQKSRKSASEEESSRRVFTDFGGPQVMTSLNVESTTEGGVEKTSVTKSEKMEYASCEFESTRKSTILHDAGSSEEGKSTSGESRKQSYPKFTATEASIDEEETVTKSQVEQIIKQELNKVFQMAQAMEKTNLNEMYDQQSQQASQSVSQVSAVKTKDRSSQKVEQTVSSSEYREKKSYSGEPVTKPGKLTSGLTVAPDRTFTPQPLESSYPLTYQNIPTDFPLPRFPPGEPKPEAKLGYIPITGSRDSPLIQALTIAPDRPYSPLPIPTAAETPSFITPPKPQASSMLEALTTAPSIPFEFGEANLSFEESTTVKKTTKSKQESVQKYAPKPTHGDFKPISTAEPETCSKYASLGQSVERSTVKSYQPVTDELKSSFKSTSKVQSQTAQSEMQQSVKSHQRSLSASRVERPITPSGLHPPDLLPYYQRNIGEIPLAHRSNSPVPHQIKAPELKPPRPESVPHPTTERRGSVKAMSEAYSQQLEALSNKYQPTPTDTSISSVSYVSAGAFSSGSVTKTYSYEQEHKSIDTMGYHASPLAGKRTPLAGERTNPKCSSPVLGKLDHTKQVFKPAIPVQQPTTLQSPIAEQANLRQAPPFFTQEKEKPQTPWVVVKEDKENSNVPSFKLPPPPKPTLKPSLPTFPIVNKAPAFPEPPKPAPGLKPPSVIPDAGPGGAKGASTAGTTAPRRGRGVLNAAVGAGGRVPLCGSCNSQIRGPFITALGKIWCPDHFVCVNAQCRRPLQDIGFVEEEQGLYCEYCFEQYLAPSCNKCNAKIKGDCLNAIGKHFHPECFTCAYCGKLFGNTPFFLEDALPYCEADWNELFTTKCFSCGFPIEAGDRWVEALNNNYHSQCFSCTMCKKNLEGQSFFAKGGRPFCKNHAR